jgi:hypothetical protein
MLQWTTADVTVTPSATAAATTVMSSTSSTATPTSTNAPQMKKTCPKCPKQIRANYRHFVNGNYTFAVKAEMVTTKRKSGKRVVQLEVQEIFKQTSMTIARNLPAKVFLWTNSSSKCVCPKMKKGQTYLVCGHEDTVKDRLLLTTKTIVSKWKVQFQDDVPSWLKRAARTAKTVSPVTQKPPETKKIGSNGRPYRVRKSYKRNTE